MAKQKTFTIIKLIWKKEGEKFLYKKEKFF